MIWHGHSTPCRRIGQLVVASAHAHDHKATSTQTFDDCSWLELGSLVMPPQQSASSTVQGWGASGCPEESLPNVWIAEPARVGHCLGCSPHPRAGIRLIPPWRLQPTSLLLPT